MTVRTTPNWKFLSEREAVDTFFADSQWCHQSIWNGVPDRETLSDTLIADYLHWNNFSSDKTDLPLTGSPARNCCHPPRDRSGAADETFRGVSFRRRPTGSHDLVKCYNFKKDCLSVQSSKIFYDKANDRNFHPHMGMGSRQFVI